MRAWLLEHLPKTGFDQFRIRQDKSTEPERVDGPNGPITFSLADWWDPGDAVILPAIEKGYPWGGVGTAFDYRLRYLFDAAPPERLVAHRGMQRLSIVVGKGEELRAWIELKEALGALGPHLHRGLLEDPSEELRLNHLCYVLALYEQCTRTMVRPDWPIAALGADASLDSLLALAPPGVPAELCAMNELFCHTQAELLGATSFHLNPRFEGSILLGGADADLIVDGVLLELKTTKAAVPARPELWQLAGYALADLDDEYGICKVGFYFGRHGSAITWPVGEFFDQLAGKHVDLTDLRAAFGEMLEDNFGGASSLPSVSVSFSNQAPPPVVARVRRVEQAVVFRPIAGAPKGKWHASVLEPSRGRSERLRQPACGAKGTFDANGPSVVAEIGLPIKDADPKVCKRCFRYSSWWAPEHLEKLPVFHEPTEASARWHRAGESMDPACGAETFLKRDGEWFVNDPAKLSDERMCGRCAKGLAGADGESNG